LRLATPGPGRLAIAAALLTLIACVATAAAQKKTPAPPAKSAADLAADVVRTTTEYRAVLVKQLPGFEAEVNAAAEALEERRALHKLGHLTIEYVQEAERALAQAQQNLVEARADIDFAERMIAEASLQEHLARLRPLARGGFEDTATLVRFNGVARWSLKSVSKIEQAFSAAFSRALPISSYGQTKVHDRLGLDHRDAIDVAVHPDSSEGRWLLTYLRRESIPFIGIRGAIPGTSTGAHVHVGPASSRLGTRR
jgi:hypothetical protein